MTTFHEREQAFEAKYARDEEFRFLVTARRDKLFARWTAARLSISDERGEALLKAVLAIPNGPGHDQAVLQQIADFLSEHGRPEARQSELSAALEQCMQQARQQLLDMPFGHSDAP